MNNVEKIKSRYDRYSYVYDILEYLPEKLIFAKYREAIIPKLTGRVLEVGVGTGKNLPYYITLTTIKGDTYCLICDICCFLCFFWEKKWFVFICS